MSQARTTAASGHPRQGSQYASEHWRNSLLAVDDDTGEVVGVVARNVSMTQTAHSPSDFTYRNAETAATVYKDSDVPASRKELSPRAPSESAFAFAQNVASPKPAQSPAQPANVPSRAVETSAMSNIPAQQSPRPTSSTAATSPKEPQGENAKPLAATNVSSSATQAHARDKSSATVQQELVKPEKGAHTLSPSGLSFRNAETAATAYHDPDVRPSSQMGSVLGIDTFAPPPTPPKRQQNQASQVSQPAPSKRSSIASTASLSSRSTRSRNDSDSEGEAVDGRVRTRASHVEVHRPDLLRDSSSMSNEGAPGSVLGGPVVQLWNKARGGEKGAAKRKAKKEESEHQKAKEASEASTVTVKDEGMSKKDKKQDKADKSSAITAKNGGKTGKDGKDKFEKSSADTVENEDKPKKEDKKDTADSRKPSEHKKEATDQEDVTKSKPIGFRGHLKEQFDERKNVKIDDKKGANSRKEMSASEVRTAEDSVWREAIESDALPLDAAYTHLAVSGQTSKTPSSPSITDKATASKEQKPPSKAVSPLSLPMQGQSVLIDFLAGSRIVASVLGTNAPRKAEPQPIAQSQAPAHDVPRKPKYLPVLPAHLLYYFGLQANAKEDDKTGGQDTSSESTAGADLMSFVPSASAVKDGAYRGACLAATMAKIGLGASLWLGSTIVSMTRYLDEDDKEGKDAEGDAAAKGIPELDPDSLTGTPRQVYRRKKPVPSATGGMYVRQQSEAGAPGDEAANEAAGSAMTDGSQRVSIIHVDEHGVGRRALTRSTHD